MLIDCPESNLNLTRILPAPLEDDSSPNTHLNVPLDLHMEVKKKMEEARAQYGESEGCYVYPRTLEDKLGEPLSLKGWDNWGYDIKVVDGSIVVNHKNRPQSKHPQYNSKS